MMKFKHICYSKTMSNRSFSIYLASPPKSNLQKGLHVTQKPKLKKFQEFKFKRTEEPAENNMQSVRNIDPLHADSHYSYRLPWLRVLICQSSPNPAPYCRSKNLPSKIHEPENKTRLGQSRTDTPLQEPEEPIETEELDLTETIELSISLQQQLPTLSRPVWRIGKKWNSTEAENHHLLSIDPRIFCCLGAWESQTTKQQRVSGGEKKQITLKNTFSICLQN